MKKNFENPVMQVSLFDVENIVTGSADPKVTNLEVAQDNVQGIANLKEVKFSEIQFNF